MAKIRDYIDGNAALETEVHGSQSGWMDDYMRMKRIEKEQENKQKVSKKDE